MGFNKLINRSSVQLITLLFISSINSLMPVDEDESRINNMQNKNEIGGNLIIDATILQLLVVMKQ